MNSFRLRSWPWLGILWVGAVGSLIGMAVYFRVRVGWDLAVYQEALRDLRGDQDIYAAAQIRLAAAQLREEIGYGYVYPPITLPLLHLVNLIPALLGRWLFWLAYCAGFAGQLWAGYQLALPAERRIVRYCLPLVVFFPAFMPNEVILSGNIVVPLYGAILATAVRGWRKNRWGCFYLVVLLASLFKLPLLSWLAIPLLAGSRQLWPSIGAGAAGGALFFGQRLIWAKQFVEYLQLVRLQAEVGNSAGGLWYFGASVPGILASALKAAGRPFMGSSTILFFCHASLLLGTLIFFGWQHRRRLISDHTWMAVLWLGIVLLSPRIMPYDTLPVTLPMLLLLLRGWQRRYGRWLVIAGLGGAASGFIVNHDGVEISCAMWGLLLSGLQGLFREAQTARTQGEVAPEITSVESLQPLHAR